MKVMKRWMGTLLALTMVIAICPAGWAASEPYAFEEWDMEITVPEGDYYVLLRDMDPESQTLIDVGLTAEQVNEIFETSNTYLNALYYDASYEIAVMVMTGETFETTFDYALLSKLERNMVATQSKKEIERQGFTVVDDISWYEGKEAVFYVVELVLPDSNDWSYQYQTVYNGRMYTIGASSGFLDSPTDEIKEQVRLLAEGIHFTRKLPVPEEVQKVYEEDENGPSMLMDILKNALIGAVVGGGGYIVFDLLRKKKGKKTASESEKLTGEDEL